MISMGSAASMGKSDDPLAARSAHWVYKEGRRSKKLLAFFDRMMNGCVSNYGQKIKIASFVELETLGMSSNARLLGSNPVFVHFSQFVFLQSLILALEIKISSLLSLSFFDRLSSCYYYPPPRTCMTPFLDPNHWLSVINSLDLKNLATKLVIRNCLIINFYTFWFWNKIVTHFCNNTK